MHHMKVQTKYYNLLKSGKKVVELRLFDEKRQQIKIGDEIVFSNLSDTNDSFVARVINLYRAESFDKLCQIITPAQAGFTSKEELITVLQEFYTPDSQQKYGVLDIEIQKI